MKKNRKKLHLHRETLALLDRQVSAGGGEVLAYVTSCTYPCDCQPGGCTADQPCLDQDAR